jgi:tagaturonate reductase
MKSLQRTASSSDALPVNILQFGYGNFLRGFADWMVEVANEKRVFKGRIEVVQIHSTEVDDRIGKQDGLFHVIERGQSKGELVDRATLISCVERVTSIFEDYESYLKLGENPDLEFVISNTTESGIRFDSEDLPIDAISKTFPGKLTALLFRRFNHFQGDPEKGLIFLPCELIENNGGKLKECILSYAALWSLPAEFSDWMESNNDFCNTLVDRIVPGFPKGAMDEIEEKTGFQDELAVMVEPYHLWAIEGPRKVKELFPMDQAGLNIKFVADLSPYRTMKVRILNGAHTALVPYAYLHGFRTVREAVEDSRMGDYLKKAIFEEIIPSMDFDETELKAFAKDVLERFANPFIRHELKSIALNSISKFKVRVLPSLLSYWEKNQSWPQNLTLGFAALVLFYKGNFKEEVLPLNDDPEVISFFSSAWKNPTLTETLEEICTNESLWGENLASYEGLITELEKSIQQILSSSRP